MNTIWVLVLISVTNDTSNLLMVEPVTGIRHAFASVTECQTWKQQFEAKSKKTPGRENDIWHCVRVDFEK
jgi:hypothetical protein